MLCLHSVSTHVCLWGLTNVSRAFPLFIKPLALFTSALFTSMFIKLVAFFFFPIFVGALRYILQYMANKTETDP